MNKLPAVVVMLLLACTLVAAACGSGSVADTDPSTTTSTVRDVAVAPPTSVPMEADALYPVLVDGRWGFIDNTGVVRIEPQFAGIRRLDGEGGLVGFCEGLCAVQSVENGPWGFIDTAGRMVVEPQFDLAQWFSEGLAVVRSGDDWYFIDDKGAKVLGPFAGAMSFRDGLASVSSTDHEVWFIDRAGERVNDIEDPEGERIRVSTGYAEGLAVAYTAEGSGEGLTSAAGYVDPYGALLIGPAFDVATEFSEGLAAVGIGENDDVMEFGYIDKTGSWIIPPRFWQASPFSEGLARVAVKTEVGVKIGFIDKTGAWAIEPRFDDAHSFREGLAIAWEGEKCGYVDKTGTVVIPLRFQLAGFDFSGGVAPIDYRYDGAQSYIDRTGHTIWRSE